MFTIKKLLLVLLIISSHQNILSKGNTGQQCQGDDGVHYYCAGFCCPALGCCSYSSLWYAWALLALILLMCACGCAGCGARRYYNVNRVSLNQQRNKHNNNRTTNMARGLERQTRSSRAGYNTIAAIQQEPRNYNATTSTNKHVRFVEEEPPPAYTAGATAPPPYNYAYRGTE